MKTCVFPGSFDPVTVGHLDLIRRAALLFDRVTVTVMINRNKKGRLSVEQRVDLLRKACAGMEHVRVESWDGLLADYMKQHGERCAVRGARSVSEFDTELAVAAANRLLDPEMETVLMFAGPGLECVSSSAVREIASFGGDIGPFVPEAVREEIITALSDHAQKQSEGGKDDGK